MSNVSYKLLFKLAWEKESPEAMWRVAVRYKRGVGVDRDMKKARYLLVKAARARNMFGMWLLAIAFANGKWGLPVNKSKANYWYLQLFRQWVRDSAQGDANARYFVDMHKLEQIQDPSVRKLLGLPQQADAVSN